MLKATTPKIALAVTDVAALTQQTAIDQVAIDASSLSLEECKQTTFSKAELSAGLRKAVSSNEDVGRYVGYGWKEITRG